LIEGWRRKVWYGEEEGEEEAKGKVRHQKMSVDPIGKLTSYIGNLLAYFGIEAYTASDYVAKRASINTIRLLAPSKPRLTLANTDGHSGPIGLCYDCLPRVVLHLGTTEDIMILIGHFRS
jgi:hypothetical protein